MTKQINAILFILWAVMVVINLSTTTSFSNYQLWQNAGIDRGRFTTSLDKVPNHLNDAINKKNVWKTLEAKHCYLEAKCAYGYW